jgi:FKBP-type peptidyl-prolyl cis-trans isomerase FklB
MNHIRSMKKSYFNILKGLVYFLPFYLFTFLFLSSCSESSDEVEEFPDWENVNLKRWNSIYAQAKERIAAGDTSWKIIKNWSYEDSIHAENTSYIVVHVLNEGTGSGCPLYTDSVRVHYRGRLTESASYPNGYEFDSSMGSSTSYETAAPAQFLVSKLTDGFATALQHMHIGDEWEVYIPWTLGYGTVATSKIPAYSVLVFTIKLDSYYRAGQEVPDFKAKKNNSWLIE